MSYAEQVKQDLLHIVSEMSSHPGDYSKHPDTDFSRNRKLNFSTLIHLMISLETGTVRDELLKYFSYDHSTVTNSAFYQQRAKLSEETLPFLFRSFNAHYPHVLYKKKYQLLAADGSSFTFTRNPLDPDSYFAPDGKTTNGYNQIHIVPLFDLISKRYTDCVIQPIRKKNEFRALCTLIDNHPSISNSTPIFIADRGFHSMNVFAHAIEHKAYFLKNVVYEYSLAHALNDGMYVKIPAVITRRDFHPEEYTPEQLDREKLNDGVRLHEEIKSRLEVYARTYGKPIVHPFVLVVAKDTEHSRQIREYLTSNDFFNGFYADKVLEINSSLRGAEKDENIQRLLQLESPDNTIEIVVHVNMLKEGWDVTNLFTIVPLRASASETLTEQTIGRGLRLPYGERTGMY